MKKFNFFSVLLSAALLSGVTASTTVSAADQFVTIGTGGVTGVYYPTGGSICRLVNKDNNINLWYKRGAKRKISFIYLNLKEK